MVTIDDVPDTIALLVYADTHYGAKEEMAALAGEMEASAVAVAADPETRTGIGPERGGAR